MVRRKKRTKRVSKSTIKEVMKKAAKFRKDGHTPREALKLAWKSVRR